jgi:hypothetical protein
MMTNMTDEFFIPRADTLRVAELEAENHSLRQQLEAYQAAAPIDNVREALEKAATIALNGCLVPPDGGSPTENEIAMCDDIAKSIRALIPSTQAKKGE